MEDEDGLVRQLLQIEEIAMEAIVVLWENVTLRNESKPNLLNIQCYASSLFLLTFFNPQKDAYAKYPICSF